MKRLYMLFSISGALGLLYQVIWARMLVLIFGNTTYSTTTVLSVFMGGLALGSSFFGWLSDKKTNNLQLWGILEFFIGLSALLVVVIFPYVNIFYTGSTFMRFIISALLILPPTFFMGGTLPVLIRHLNRNNLAATVSKLYFVNTLGAFIGTLITAFILLEILGMGLTVLFAAWANISLGLMSFTIKLKNNKSQILNKTIKKKTNYSKTTIIFIMLSFFMSGAISLSYEIVWTRLLISSLGTYVYAFAIILATILLGIATGAIITPALTSKTNKYALMFGIIQMGIGLLAVISLLILGLNLNMSTPIKLISVLLPASVLMGMSFPVVSALFENSQKLGTQVGLAYSLNTAGSIVGPIITGFFLIGFIGTSHTLLLLSILNLTVGGLLIASENKKFAPLGLLVIIPISAIIITAKNTPQLYLEKSIKEKISYYESQGWNWKIMEDEAASILAFAGDKSPSDKGLIIDGVQTTTLTIQTKLLAHLPLFLHKNPENMLIIAFGMGTTYRSALVHDIYVDAVELVPSVPKTFAMFYKDGSEVLNNPKGKIIINDGRNYISLTDKKYDIIAIDPPPPINAAGTTVLYSQEFYEDARKILNPGGIVAAWFWYGASEDDFKMLFASMRNVFPHILVAVSPDGRGVFFFGSEDEIIIDKKVFNERYQGWVYQDVNEWSNTPYRVGDLMELFVGDEKTIDRFVNNAMPLTDDHPKTEYFYLRHKLNPLPNISPDWVHPIPESFDKTHGISRL